MTGDPKSIGDLLAGVPLTPPEGVESLGPGDREHHARKVVDLPVGERAKAAKAGLRKRFEVTQTADVDELTNEQLADQLVRMSAYMILFGGQEFTPQNLSDATKVAATWAAIAKSETVRKGRAKDDVAEVSPSEELAKALRGLKDQLKARKSG